MGPDNRGKITGVFDVNSIRFMEYLQHMNEEIFPDQPVYYGGALNYAGNNIRAISGRMRKKMEAGMCIFPDTADILRGRCTESDRAERDDGCEDYLWSDAVSQLQKCTIYEE